MLRTKDTLGRFDWLLPINWRRVVQCRFVAVLRGLGVRDFVVGDGSWLTAHCMPFIGAESAAVMSRNRNAK